MSFSPDSSPPDSPVTPGDNSPAPSPPPLGLNSLNLPQRQVPSLRSISDGITTPSSTPLGPVLAARRPGVPLTSSAGSSTFSSLKSGCLPNDIQARLQAFHASRIGTTPPSLVTGGLTGAPVGPPNMGSPGGLLGRPPRPMVMQNWNSAPAIAGRLGPKPSLGQRRGLKLPGGLPGGPSPGGDNSNGAGKPDAEGPGDKPGSLFNKYAEYVDTNSGSLKFAGKAVIHSKGVDFSSGSTFRISLDEVDRLDELGKGNYGTVYKVIHSRPLMRSRGMSSGRSSSPLPSSPRLGSNQDEKAGGSPTSQTKSQGTGVVMAMKEIRLELDEAKFAQIIMELDVLHKCRSPFIIDFYGAFFQEGAVYICMEYMDGGSIDKIYNDGVPENVLRKITYATVQGLKTLKDDHNIIHRDVKPTNILVNTRGEIKLCDFGVSGNLVASIAKTNIGCQSYMAPERIASGGMQSSGTAGSGTYSVQSDIWSLGLSILECAMGCYPYPPETYNNIFSQLSAIVDGEPPDLPAEGFSDEARDFVRGCLHKIPKLRPTYSMLLAHPWINTLNLPPTISEVEDEDNSNEEAIIAPPRFDKEVSEWVIDALEKRKTRIAGGGKAQPEKPALHAAPLDVVSSPAKDLDIPANLGNLKIQDE